MDIISESDIKKKMLMMFIAGFIIGVFWGYKGEDPPHDVWLFYCFIMCTQNWTKAR